MKTGNAVRQGAEMTPAQAKYFGQGPNAHPADKGHAMPDGSQPINNWNDLKRAIAAWDKAPASEQPMLKAHIIGRAKALKGTQLLPKGWMTDAPAASAGAMPMKSGAMAGERDYSTASRAKLADAGKALPDGSFPINTEADLKNAIAAYGRAKNPAAAKAHIIKRAKALKLTALLPDDWQTGKDDTPDEAGVGEATEGVFRGRELLVAAEMSFVAAEDGKPSNDVEIVLVRPGESANRRVYSREAIAEAVNTGFWNGSRMFIDHGDMAMPTKRSLKDLVSVVRDTHLGPAGEAIGHARFIRPDFAQFVRDAHDASPDALGVSIVHRFQGARFKGTDGLAHERVDHFLHNFSVDWVAFPAAGGSINQFLPAQESTSEDDVEWNELTADMVKAHAPAVYDAIVGEATSEDDSMNTGIDAGTAGEGADGAGSGQPAVPVGLTLETVQQMIDDAIANDRKVRAEEAEKQATVGEQITTLVGKSGLPELTRKRIVKQFAGAGEYVEATVQEAIDEAKAELKSLTGTGPMVRGLGSSFVGTEAEGVPDEKVYPDMVAFEQAFGVKNSTVAEGQVAK